MFTTYLEDIVRQAKREGTFDLGILEIKGSRPDAVTEASAPSQIYASAEAQEAAYLHDIQLDKGVMWEEAEQV